MTRNKRLKYVELALLTMIWLILIVSPILFRKDTDFEWTDMRGPVQTILPLFLLFILNRFLLVPYLLFKKKSVLYFLSVAFLITFMTLGLYFFDDDGGKNNRSLNPETGMQARPPQNRIDPGMPPPPHPGPKPDQGPANNRPIPPFANFIIFSVLLIGFDTGLRFSFRMAEAEQIKDKLEKDNVESQLAFLRNQVSPHFFMNTLNNIHSLIDFDTGEAKESIIRLSKLMRHLLYDSDSRVIPIKKEIDFIQNYVDLMKLRFSDKVKINLNLPDQIPDKSIPPLLFTSYLENAFKHGISYQHSSFIDITLSYANDQLIFEILNSNAPTENKQESYGIGIENSRRRLDLLYANKYELKIRDDHSEYYVFLSIPI